ncbi:modulator of macroautophagy TMEM150B-like [Rhinatrema bivittatum]|uniref:modulator of macroautophagy TMEM150B-like n=1 Tax=Rhinatrema bivittatum TaxID=194408 RepID=UPI0011287995|nr:modulator of macroautophagy TMEM150B-like [Rhinatrema bivittatum]
MTYLCLSLLLTALPPSSTARWISSGTHQVIMWSWALLPITLLLGAVGGILTACEMAAVYDWLKLSDVPYISACGINPPQKCIYIQTFNTGAWLALCICLLRYQQLRDLGHQSRLNQASFGLGLFCSSGASLMANFQECSQELMHQIWAYLVLLSGTAYFWMQVVFTYRIKPHPGGPWIGPARVGLCTLSTLALGFLAWFHDSNLQRLSGISEWVCSFSLFSLFGLFAVDFCHLEKTL